MFTQNTLVYTFASSHDKVIPKLNQLGLKYVVLHKLKEDLQKIFIEILKNKDKYDSILGITHTKRKYSSFEKFAINEFHKRKIYKLGKATYELSQPDELPEDFREYTPTTTFCNWSMYKMSKFIEDNKLHIPFYFVHLTKNHKSQLIEILNTIDKKSEKMV